MTGKALFLLLIAATWLLVQSSHPSRKATGLAQRGARRHASKHDQDEDDNAEEPTDDMVLRNAGTRAGNQAPSLGQDLQECGFVRLPSKLELAPRVSETFTRSGIWATDSGATLVTWSQKLYGMSFQNAYFFTDEKSLFKTEVLESEYELGPDLPVPPLEHEGEATTILLKDCMEVILYLIRQKNDDDKTINIYNNRGQLVAQSARSPIFPDQLHFYDELGEPLAYAQSPFVTDKVLGSPVKVYHPEGLEPWEIIFVEEFQSNSSLVLSQNRWIIAAAVQEIAIRDAFLNGPGRVESPSVLQPRTWTAAWLWFNVFCIVVCLGICSLCSTTCSWTYHLVYPKKQELIQNPFLREPSMYGALPTTVDQRA